MTRRLRFAALAAVAALAFSACSNNDAKESDVVNAMEDSLIGSEELTDEEATAAAECIGQGVDEAFGDDQGLYNEIAGVTDVDEFPERTREQIDGILDDCLDGVGSVAPAGPSDTTDDEG